jgi:hypothetical protein
MTSVAERKRHRKAARAIAAATPNLAPSPQSTTVVAPAQYREKTGLDWLQSRNKLNASQVKAGKRYGALFRVVQVNGMVPLASCLDDTPRGSMGRPGPALAIIDLQAQERLAAARAALSHQADMISVCDAVCGRDMTPWEITNGNQREADKLMAALRIALDILSRHNHLTS